MPKDPDSERPDAEKAEKPSAERRAEAGSSSRSSSERVRSGSGRPGASKKARDPDLDEDLDDEDPDVDEDEEGPPAEVDEDDEPRESRPAKKPVAKAARPHESSRPVPGRPAHREAARVIDEEALRAPDRQTLWMLGAVTAAALFMWGMSRAACNYSPPIERRSPRVVTLEDLASTAKDAAIEFQQRFATYDFNGALELASGAVGEELRRAAAKCSSDANCQAKRERLSQAVLTTGELMTPEGTTAEVRVTTHNGENGTERQLLALERAGNVWKVTARTPAPPDPAPAPTGSNGPSLQVLPSSSAAPSASAAPSPSAKSETASSLAKPVGSGKALAPAGSAAAPPGSMPKPSGSR